MSKRSLLALDRAAGHLGRQAQRHALLGENPGGFLPDIAVHPGEQLVKIFDHGHLGAKPAPHAAKFQPDHPAADHDHRLGHGRQFQPASGIDHHALGIVDLDAR